MSSRLLSSPSCAVARASLWQTRTVTQVYRQASSNSNSNSSTTTEKANDTSKSQSDSKPATKKKTQSQLDEELRLKMAGLSGEGGEAGVEYEDGVPVSMKRSVKNNMFRYI